MDVDASVAREQHSRGRMARPATIAVIAATVVFALGAAWLVWTMTGPAATPAGELPAPVSGPVQGAPPVEGSEVLPPEPGTGTGDAGLPPVTRATPLVTGPLPPTAAAEGGLVAGVPADIIGPRDGDDVIRSSVTSEGTALQAAMTARTDGTTEEVRQYFRERWAPIGLGLVTDTPGELSFQGPAGSLTLSVTAGGTGTVYTVFAVLRTE